MVESQITGPWLREERLRLGLSLEQLAAAASMSAAGLWRIEAGNRVPRRSTKKLLWAALKRAAEEMAR